MDKAYVHTVIDNHCRGITVKHVLSDNGGAYRSHLWRDTCATLWIMHHA